MVNLINRKVKHTGKLGVGTVIDQDGKNITVQFSSKISKFVYPTAFEKFLVAEEQEISDAIKAEIEAEKIKEQAVESKVEKNETKKQETTSAKKINISKKYIPKKREDGQALTYLVFQGSTYKEECTGQFLWAPKYTKEGKTMHHWERLMDVREGDVIFHCSNGYIQAISRAKGSCVDSARPDLTTGDWTNWEKDGRRVDCDYYVLKTPLKHGLYKEKILEFCNVKYAPFDKAGNGNMGYLFDLDYNLATFFVQEIVKKNLKIRELDFLKFLL